MLTMAATGLLAALWIQPIAAQSIHRVLPASYANVEGNSSENRPFGHGVWGTGALRMMQAYGRSTADFDRPVVISAIRFRHNGGPVATFSGTSFNYSLSLSTSRNPATALSAQFDDNHGADRTEVYNTNGWTPGYYQPALNASPNPFSFTIPIKRFEWDPRSGPLLLDIQYAGAFFSQPAPLDAVDGTGDDVGRIMHLGSATAALATHNGGVTENRGFVMQLVTEPKVAPIGPATNWALYPWGASNPARVQMAYAPSEIPFTGRHSIHTLRWRVAPGYTFAGATYDLGIHLSTMPQPASTMQTQFSQNWGADRTIVFNGTHVAPAGDIIEIPLTTPFEYDPALGPLLVDIALGNSPSNPYPPPRFESTWNTESCWRIYHSSDPNAASANQPMQQLGLVMEMVAERAPTIPQASDLSFGTYSVYPFNLHQPHRVMQLYHGSTFEGGSSGLPLFIQHLRWRPHDFGNGASFGPVTYTCTIDLALRDATSGTLSHTFDANGLINKQRVFEGSFSVPYIESLTDPDEFPIAVKLDQPYHFMRTPSPGSLINYDLVVDIRMLATNGSTQSCDGKRNTVDVWRVANFSDPNATVANYPASSGPDHFALAMRTGGHNPNATSENYGSGCPGTAGTPRCVTTNLPVLPSKAFTVKLLDGLPGSLAVLRLGVTQQNSPFPGMPGCTLLTGAEIGSLGVIIDAQGEASLPFGLTGAPGFDGFQFATQWAVFDVAANAFGAVLSDAQLHTARFR